MKKLLILLILLNGCSFSNVGYFDDKSNKLNNSDIIKINYEDDYTFNEYKDLLKNYSKIKKYPNMNK